MKRVRVTLELGADFVRLLNARVRLGLLEKARTEAQLDPVELVGLLVWSEACGHHPEQQAALVPPCSRPHAPEVVNEERRYQEEPGGPWKATA